MSEALSSSASSAAVALIFRRAAAGAAPASGGTGRTPWTGDRVRRGPWDRRDPSVRPGPSVHQGPSDRWGPLDHPWGHQDPLGRQGPFDLLEPFDHLDLVDRQVPSDRLARPSEVRVRRVLDQSLDPVPRFEVPCGVDRACPAYLPFQASAFPYPSEIKLLLETAQGVLHSIKQLKLNKNNCLQIIFVPIAIEKILFVILDPGPAFLRINKMFLSIIKIK